MNKKLQNIVQLGMKKARNIYVVTGVLFLVWVAFFDNNNLYHIYRLSEKENELKEQKSFYEKEIVTLKEDLDELSSDPKKLEKFARETYLFHYPKEDVYVIKEAD